MADEESKPEAENEDEMPSIVVPSHDPLPPPPDIHFTPPSLERKKSTPSRSPGGALDHRTDVSRPEEDSGIGKLGAGLAASVSFGASILVGFMIGQWIDHRWNHSSILWGTLIMTLIGVAAGFFNIIRLTSSPGRKRDRK